MAGQKQACVSGLSSLDLTPGSLLVERKEGGREGGQVRSWGRGTVLRALEQAGPGCQLQEGLVPGPTSTGTGTEE